MQWSRDLTIESHLNDINIGWDFREAIPFDTIHVDRGPQNNARLTCVLDDDKIEEYALAMRQGATFPAVVLYPNCTGLDIAGGNHRLRGLKKASLHNSCPPSAYVLDADDPVKVELVIRTLNLLNGLGISNEDKIAQAIHFYEKNPEYDRAALALRFQIKVDTFNRAVRAHDVATELKLQGVKGVDALGSQTLGHLYKFRKETPVQVALARVAISEDYGADTVKLLAGKISSERSENNKLEAIVQFVESTKAIRKSKPTQKMARPAGRLQAAFSVFETVLTNYPSWDALHLTSKSEQAEVRRQRDGLIAKLNKVLS